MTDSAAGSMPAVDRNAFDGTRFALLDHNATALAVRLELCAGATRRLDLLYYIFREDDSGRLVADALMAAADRGVQVRLLLDDLDASGRESSLGRLDAHPRLQVRLFNPFRWRGLLRPLALLRDPARLTRRMHAKALIADSRLAVVGGRNIGDEYYAPEAEMAFADVDVLLAGELVGQVDASFESLWSSVWAKPLAELRARRAAIEVTRRARDRIARRPVHQDPAGVLAEDSQAKILLQRIRAGSWPDLPGTGRVFADLPEKVEPGALAAAGYFDHVLQHLVTQAVSEVLIMTPYLVPTAEGMAFIHALKERGLRIRILTNSLAATDVVAVHAGYRRYRRALLEAGVELYEYRPTGYWGRRLRRMIRGAHLRASLHAKTILVDDELVMIGSANLDPRSIQLNLELGILIESAPLGAEIRACFEDAIAPANAWRVELEQGREQWRGADGRHEPDAGWGRRLLARLLGFLPLEGQL